MKETKYIQIRYWDYWYSMYGLCKSGIANVDFKLTNDRDEDNWFFFIELYNNGGMKSVLDSMETPDFDDDISRFQKAAESFANGESDHFISGVYFDTKPILDNNFIEAELGKTGSLINIRPQIVHSTCAVIFINESRSMTPEVLIGWMTKLSPKIFGKEYNFEIADIPTYEAAAESFNSNDYIKHLYMMRDSDITQPPQ